MVHDGTRPDWLLAQDLGKKPHDMGSDVVANRAESAGVACRGIGDLSVRVALTGVERAGVATPMVTTTSAV
jgi:hypothetical protein